MSGNLEDNPNFNKNYLIIGLILIELPILIWTYYRYTRQGKIKELEEKYSDTKYDRVRPWHVFMLPIFFIILMLIMVFTFRDAAFLPNS